MKTFKKTCAQGDVYIERVKSIPKKAVRLAKGKNKHVIITHSETGHHHVMLAEKTTVYELPDSIRDIFVEVEKGGDELTHLRDHHTHESIRFEPGVYRVRRQREFRADAPAAQQERFVQD